MRREGRLPVVEPPSSLMSAEALLPAVDTRGDVTLNQGSYSALDGARFVASILALAKKHRANIGSRPIILTQENVPAIFDNNRTFYTRLLGERSVVLREVTYGTMISVLSRFSGGDEVEMALTIEDGGEVARQHRNPGPDDLPEVGRTHISTVARVPRGKSLLIGGYTRDEIRDNRGRLSGLGSDTADWRFVSPSRR